MSRQGRKFEILRFLKSGLLNKKRIKFGITWWKIIPTPYTHCNTKIDTSGYRKVLIMPFIILGVIPFLIGILIGSGLVTIFGATLMIGAVGDLMIMGLLPIKQTTFLKLF